MKSGVIRKLDELGRVVIPIEIRKTLDIEVGSLLEFYMNDRNEVTIKKVIGGEENYLSSRLAEDVYKHFNFSCFVTNGRQIMASRGIDEKTIDLNKFNFNDLKVNTLTKDNSNFYVISLGDKKGSYLVVESCDDIDVSTQNGIEALCSFAGAV